MRNGDHGECKPRRKPHARQGYLRLRARQPGRSGL
jgi:hypothetical protein